MSKHMFHSFWEPCWLKKGILMSFWAWNIPRGLWLLGLFCTGWCCGNTVYRSRGGVCLHVLLMEQETRGALWADSLFRPQEWSLSTPWGTEERSLHMINRLQQGLRENPCLVCTRPWVRTLGLQNQRLKSAFRVGSAVLLDRCDL